MEEVSAETVIDTHLIIQEQSDRQSTPLDFESKPSMQSAMLLAARSLDSFDLAESPAR